MNSSILRISFMVISILLVSCNLPKNEKPITNDSTGNQHQSAKSGSIIPENLRTFLNKEMPGWRLVSKKQWLAEDYINSYFDDGTGAEKTAYEKNIFIKGDFNGDKKEDYACFLMNSENNNIMLLAFHQKDNGFDKFEISDEGPLIEDECCLGAGLGVIEPALIENAFYDKNYPENGVEKVDLKYNGIEYMLYEKSSKLFFFDGEKYSSFFLGD